MTASGGTLGDYLVVNIAAPPGEALVSGAVYTEAQRTTFRRRGHAGIEITSPGRGCSGIDGLFELKELAFDGSGGIARLWLVYEQRCSGERPALGRSQNRRAGNGGAHRPPRVVRWPVTEPRTPGTAVPVTLVVHSDSTLAAATLTGAGAAAFAIESDECAGTSRAAGSTCRVWVRFKPTAAGTRSRRCTSPTAPAAPWT